MNNLLRFSARLIQRIEGPADFHPKVTGWAITWGRRLRQLLKSEADAQQAQARELELLLLDDGSKLSPPNQVRLEKAILFLNRARQACAAVLPFLSCLLLPGAGAPRRTA